MTIVSQFWVNKRKIIHFSSDLKLGPDKPNSNLLKSNEPIAYYCLSTLQFLSLTGHSIDLGL